MSISVINRCYATGWSYGEICVHCNCCGRYQKGIKKLKARLEYHENGLYDELNFNDWFENEELYKRQMKNNKLNIEYERRKIFIYKNKIKSYKKRKKYMMFKYILDYKDGYVSKYRSCIFCKERRFFV